MHHCAITFLQADNCLSVAQQHDINPDITTLNAIHWYHPWVEANLSLWVPGGYFWKVCCGIILQNAVRVEYFPRAYRWGWGALQTPPKCWRRQGLQTAMVRMCVCVFDMNSVVLCVCMQAYMCVCCACTCMHCAYVCVGTHRLGMTV